MSEGFVYPEHLIATQALADCLNDPKVRVLDATVHLEPRPEGGNKVVSGRADFEAGHIPGARFLDLPTEVSDPKARYYFMVPPPEQFAAAIRAHGIDDDTLVVAYATANHWWATRLWWLMRLFGHAKVAVLDGGFQRWKAEGRPIATGQAGPVAAGRFSERPAREGMVATKDDVLAAINDGSVCTINALRAEQHTGAGGAHYGRPGRITGSVSIPALSMADPDSNLYRSPAELRQLLAEPLSRPRAITYCGGGIAASSVAMALTMLGHKDVRLYDASLSEWARDPSLPMETG